MTATKKLIGGNGNQYFPQTHTKAVIDDNGYSVESRMQAVQDVVNQAQMAIGAVPSDLTPTENSTNWVTSGGVFNATTVGNNVEIDLTEYTAVRAFPNPDTWVVSTAAYPYYGMFIPVNAGQKYSVTANSEAGAYYGFLTTNSYSHQANVSYATECTRVTVPAGDTVVDTAPSDAKYIWIGTYTTKDITPESFAEYHKTSVRDYINNPDAVPTEGSDKIVTSGAVYDTIALIDSSIFDASHITGSTTTLALTCNHSTNAYTYKKRYNFTIGKNYRITLSVDSAASEIISLADLPKSGYTPWITVMTLPSGSLSNTFIYTPSSVNGYLQAYSGTTVSNGKAVTAVIEELATLQDVNDELLSTKTDITTYSGNIAKIEDQVFYETGMTYKSYTGNRITPNRIGFKTVGSLVTGQSAAIFGEKAFVFGNGATSCSAYNMKTRTLIQSTVYIYGVPSKSDNTAWHCNSSEFGTDYYAEDDEFPLLYIGGSQGDAIQELLVCRVVPDTSRVYRLNVVQVLTMPDEWGYANVAFDAERGKIIFCRTNMIFRVCNPPAVLDSGGNPISTYTFTEEDCEQTITIDASSLPTPQDVAMHRGLLYLVNGHSTGTDAYFRVIDLYNGTLINDVNLTGWFTDSIEGVSFYNEHMYFFGSANIYKIWFM